MIAPQNNPTKGPKKTRRISPIYIYLVVGVSLCVIGIAMFCVNRATEDDEQKTADKKAQIVEVQPVAVAPQPEPGPVTEPIDDGKRRTAKGTVIPDKVQPDEKGILRYPNGQRWVDPNDLHIVKHPQKRLLFKRTCDNQLVNILSLDPSKMAPHLIGRRQPYGDAFIKDFHDSLYDTYEADPDDTEEEAAMRQLVMETRKELKEAMDRGEDIAKLMNQAQEELDRLCQYQDTLKKELRELEYDESVSDEDFKDFVEAANLMLQKQGLKALRCRMS